MSEPNHSEIYRHQASMYDRLIAAQPSLLPQMERIRPLHGLDVIDLGAGTGRLTLPLAASAASLLAIDTAQAMLDVTAGKLRAGGFTGWRTAIGDHLHIPAPDRSADLLVSGWSIGYSANAEADSVGQALARIIAEIRRVLRPGGTVILFETMGTGFTYPNAPDFLKPYYAALEETYGFSHTCFPLDYTFSNVEEAESLARFFFGEPLGNQVAERGSPFIPEYAGMWTRNYA